MSDLNTQPLKGFRDFLPSEAEARNQVFDKVRTTFEQYGYLPLETPAIEYKEVLSGKYGKEGDKLMYSFRDQGEREVALRYDLTVPLARVIAQYPEDLPTPFKRYQIAPVWRADRPQKGRFREFTQCDIDVIGTSSILADAEVIACLNETFKALGIEDVIVRVNNRKVLDGIMKGADVPAKKSVEAIRILDKLDKIGKEAVQKELSDAGIGAKEQNKLFELLEVGLEDSADIESKLDEIEGAGELAELVEALLDMEVRNYRIDLTLARGLDYYTGTIFEFILPDAADFGSVAGGGRYDKLLGMFSGKAVPAVGGSIGADRLLDALEELELVKYDLVSDVLVCNLDAKLEEKYLKVVQELRAAGIRTDFYYEPVKLDKQLKYADKKNVNFAVLIGEEEEKTEEATVKNLTTGKQERVKQKDLVKTLKSPPRG